MVSTLQLLWTVLRQCQEKSNYHDETFNHEDQIDFQQIILEIDET